MSADITGFTNEPSSDKNHVAKGKANTDYRSYITFENSPATLL